MTTPASRTPRSGFAPKVLAAELLPCPHCGGKAGFRREHDPDGHLFLRIECNQCHACSAQKWSDDPCPITYQEIRDTWNRRTPSAPPAAPAVSDGWQDMTAEAMRIQQRHLDNHDGDVYHAMQALIVRFGKPWDGVLVQSLPPREPPAAESVLVPGAAINRLRQCRDDADLSTAYREVMRDAVGLLEAFNALATPHAEQSPPTACSQAKKKEVT